jgi:hypothetical protein
MFSSNDINMCSPLIYELKIHSNTKQNATLFYEQWPWKFLELVLNVTAWEFFRGLDYWNAVITMTTKQ